MLEQNFTLKQEGENNKHMDEITVNENALKKKKSCTFSYKCVTIILAICLACSIASLLTVIMLPPPL
jgi:hypothetical protein